MLFANHVGEPGAAHVWRQANGEDGAATGCMVPNGKGFEKSAGDLRKETGDKVAKGGRISVVDGLVKREGGGDGGELAQCGGAGVKVVACEKIGGNVAFVASVNHCLPTPGFVGHGGVEQCEEADELPGVEDVAVFSQGEVERGHVF